ncbi:bifunctional cobalt-precorrin-7 (C(5))-methyltransferase/cobalt-precorrin-6B (C(15))-methyltransferase [Ferrimonas kyonanensis]|uniref:bifunctional cobalt-precorrin-7 (C(5))-methyltransferase/cobalt-precorrin-6B (C(15))-methyltransferase n=1 Tax=Ferrimonas kyonanensis TaxID=364763 RepID=UPI00041161D3|nr:bifunctional cobalt-precorrin-7 (C(5))-methyltransferase/cobalt-precorrin-6B (C(15))-methyltransferase [Ferrimonas kyonanensis]
MTGRIRLIGIGDDGCLSLTSRAINAIAEAEVLAGSQRHLAFFPQFQGQKLSLTTPLEGYLEAIFAAAEEQEVCVLASGDPLLYGIGTRLHAYADALPTAPELECIPSLSSVQLACAHLGWTSQQTQLLSVHGRPLDGLVAQLQQGDQFALLTDRDNSPTVIARHLLEFDEGHWQLHLCEAMGGPAQRVREFSVAALARGDAGDTAPLNLLLLKRSEPARWGGLGLHSQDDDFLKRTPQRGLITKAPVRAVAVANLNLHADAVVWDIGAGSGSVGIEAAKQAWKGRSFAIECNPECFFQLEGNRLAHRVDHLTVIQGRAPQALTELPAPDAVFCGGSRGEMEPIVDAVMARLKPGGRFVLSAVTLESVAEIHRLCQSRQLDPRILMINCAQSQPLAHYTRYQSDNPIHLFIIEKKAKSQ